MTEPPTVVYHYTDAAGLLGILQSESLWATDVRFLNDGEELAYAADSIVAELQHRAEAIQSQSEVEGDERATTLLGLADELSSHAAGRSGQVFVTCFCTNGDLLSQWRGYGRKEGYALGFDFEILRSTAAQHGGHLEQIDYGGEEKIRSVVEEYATMRPVGHAGTVGYVLAQNLQPLLATVKNPAFKEEDEWRLVLTGPEGWPKEMKFRVGTGLGVVPYVEIEIDRQALRTVAIGPGPNPELRRSGTQKLLTAGGWDDVDVRIKPIAHMFRGLP